MNTVPIKIQNGSDIRRVKVSPSISFIELVDLLKSLFRFSESDWVSFSLKYTDDENDLCTVQSEMELREAFHAKKQEVLKLELIRNVQQAQQPQSPFWRQPNGQACFMERINQRRVQITNLHDEGIAAMDKKNYEEAKGIFAKQAEMLRCPWKKSVPLYNIACCEALLGNVDSALAFLSQAIANGYKNVQHMETDEDLASLRGLDGFEVLLSELRSDVQKKKENRSCKWRGRFQEELIKPSCGETKPSEEIKPEVKSSVEFKPEVSPSEDIKQEDKEENQPEISFENFINPIIEAISPLVEAFGPEIAKVINSPVVQDYAAELNSLFQMGFTDIKQNLKALMKARGDLSQAVVLLLR